MRIEKLLKKTLLSFINKAGFQVRRFSDPLQLPLYESLFDSVILGSKPFYNVGSGSFYHPLWTNIDYVSGWYSPVQKKVVHHDLMSETPLPIESNSAEIVYTSHTIEHIKERAVLYFFRDTYRALKPGGIFRVTTGPDAETDFRAMSRGDKHWFYWDDAYTYSNADNWKHIYHQLPNTVPIEERWLHHVASALAPNDKSPSIEKYDAVAIRKIVDEMGFEKSLDFFTGKCDFDPNRPGNHISWWTHQKIFEFLQRAGFSNIYRSGYGQSVSPILRNTQLFDSTHPQMSIYIECIK